MIKALFDQVLDTGHYLVFVSIRCYCSLLVDQCYHTVRSWRTAGVCLCMGVLLCGRILSFAIAVQHYVVARLRYATTVLSMVMRATTYIANCWFLVPVTKWLD